MSLSYYDDSKDSGSSLEAFTFGIFATALVAFSKTILEVK